MLVTRVVGIHCDGFVAEERFWARSGDDDIVAIPDVPEMTLRLGHDDFLVGERGAAGGIPVHHALAAIDEAFFIEVNEGPEDGVTKLVVHRESFASPIARATEFFELLDDNATVFVFPFPNFFLKFFATEIVAMFDDALFLECFLDDGLGGNAGVVGAGEPEDFVALHALPAGENVLERVVEHVAHGENASDVRRRNDDGVGGFRRRRVRGEVAIAQPVGVPFVFDELRLVGFGNFGAHAGLFLPENIAEFNFRVKRDDFFFGRATLGMLILCNRKNNAPI